MAIVSDILGESTDQQMWVKHSSCDNKLEFEPHGLLNCRGILLECVRGVWKFPVDEKKTPVSSDQMFN